jgi:Domain of unknown function (DUF5134)
MNAASNMSMATGGGSNVTIGGMSMTVAHGSTNILPAWLAVIWTLVFAVIVVVHVRHVSETQGERRFWHSGHVLMGFGMLFMFAPPSLDHFGIPTAFWQLLFATATFALVIWMLVSLTNGVPVNRLWLALAFDLAAMTYMWSLNGFVPAITWVLVAYFVVQAVLWGTDRYRELDGHQIGGGLFVGGDGTVTASAVSSLVCERDLRVSMGVMALGMAYMFAAMQLVM